MKGFRLFLPAILAAILFVLPAAGAAPAVPQHGWVQVNNGGFGDVNAISVSALQEFRGSLYAGTYHLSAGGSIWRYLGGKNWERVTQLEEVSSGGNPAVTSMVVFQDRLYATTSWGLNKARVWRYDGQSWVKVLEENINGFTALAVFNNRIYVGATVMESDGTGTRILRSDTGNPDSWSAVVTGGNGDKDSYAVTSLSVFNGSLYAAVANNARGVQVWRSASGNLNNWETVVNNGFGSPANADPGGFFVHNNQVYLGVRNGPLFITEPAQSTGGRLYRSPSGNLNSWQPVTENGFGDPYNVKVEGLIAYQGAIYAFTSNPFHGMEVWVSADDGATWTRDASGGFNTVYNRNTLWNNALAVFNSQLYAGTSNYDPLTYAPENGGQVWRWTAFNHSVMMPLVKR